MTSRIHKTPRPLSIEVRFLVGTDIKDACAHIVAQAESLGCYIEADFNGFRLFAGPGTEAADLMRQWGERQASDMRGPSKAELMISAAGPLIEALEQREKLLGPVQAGEVFDMFVPVQSLIALRKAVRS